MTSAHLLSTLAEARAHTEACVLCFLERRQVTRYLTGVAADGVNNVPLRRKLAARGGYCAPHSAEFAALASPLSAAVLLEAFVKERLERAASGKRPVRLRCEACEVGVKARDGFIKTVERNRNSLEVRTSLLQSNLCLDHVERLCRFLPSDVRGAFTAQHDGLLHDLEEVIRKHDYRFQGEGVTDAEKASVKKALTLLGFVD